MINSDLLVHGAGGILTSSWNSIRNPKDCMVNCSKGPGDFDIFLKPYKKP